jgi:hypothetical protein
MSGGAWNARRERPRVADATEATLALPKIVHRGRKILGSEVRPHPVAEEEFRIRAFPQQKIRQPLLAARADKQIHIAMLGIMLARDEPAQGLARELNSRFVVFVVLNLIAAQVIKRFVLKKLSRGRIYFPSNEVVDNVFF